MEEPQGGFGDEPIAEPMDEPMGDEPFGDEEPFDAGVETSEEEDPKKFIQQLSGKLGQSLRKYTDEQGQPDLELEKFAINSVVSATHTADMDQEDKKDIIDKIESSGEEDEPMDEPMGDEPMDEPMGGEEESFDETLKISENSCNFMENPKDMIKTVLKENFDCGCDVDEIIDEIVGDQPVKPEVKPQVIPETKPTPSRRSKPFTVRPLSPEHSPKPKMNI